MAIQNTLPAAIQPDGANPAAGNRLNSYSEPFMAGVTNKGKTRSVWRLLRGMFNRGLTIRAFTAGEFGRL